METPKHASWYLIIEQDLNLFGVRIVGGRVWQCRCNYYNVSEFYVTHKVLMLSVGSLPDVASQTFLNLVVRGLFSDVIKVVEKCHPSSYKYVSIRSLL